MMQPRPERPRIRWSRVSALAGLELREFLRRPATWGALLALLTSMQIVRALGEAWFRSKGVGGPSTSRAVLNTLTWAFIAAAIVVSDRFWEKRTNREIEPVLATGMREMEILLGKIAVPFTAGLIAAGLVLAAQMGAPLLVPGLVPPRRGAALLWLVLFLPPFCAGAATLVTAAGLFVRSVGAGSLIALLGGAAGITAVWGCVAAASRLPPWIGILSWLVFTAATVGSLRAASGLLRRDRTVSRV